MNRRVRLPLAAAALLRAGASLADQNALGVGIAYRMQRRVVVR